MVYVILLLNVGYCKVTFNSRFICTCNGTTRRLFIKTFVNHCSKNSSCFGFLAILNALLLNTLSEAVVVGKSLKSP